MTSFWNMSPCAAFRFLLARGRSWDRCRQRPRRKRSSRSLYGRQHRGPRVSRLAALCIGAKRGWVSGPEPASARSIPCAFSSTAPRAPKASFYPFSGSPQRRAIVGLGVSSIDTALWWPGPSRPAAVSRAPKWNGLQTRYMSAWTGTGCGRMAVPVRIAHDVDGLDAGARISSEPLGLLQRVDGVIPARARIAHPPHPFR